MNHKTLKTVALASAALFALHFAPAASAQDTDPAQREDIASLTLDIDGLTSQAGRIWVGVYDSAEAWADQTEIRSQWVEVGEGATRYTFQNRRRNTAVLSNFPCLYSKRRRLVSVRVPENWPRRCP